MNQRLSIGQLLGQAESRKDARAATQQQLLQKAGTQAALEAYKKESLDLRGEELEASKNRYAEQLNLNRDKFDSLVDYREESLDLRESELESIDAYRKAQMVGSEGLSASQKRLLANDATSALQKMGEVKAKDSGPYIQRYVDAKRALGKEVTKIPFHKKKGNNRIEFFNIPEGYTYEQLVAEAQEENMPLDIYVRELDKLMRK